MCVCVCLYVCVAIQHESDAAGRLGAAKVVVLGTVKGGGCPKNKPVFEVSGFDVL